MTITDVSRDIRCSPDVVPVMLPSHFEVVESLDEVMAGWHLESNDTGVTQDAHLRTELCLMSFDDSASVLMSLPLVVVPSSEVTGVTGEAQLRTDVCPVMSENSVMEPMSLPVVAHTGTQVDVGWESTLVEIAIRWDGSILNLTVGWWMRLY